MAKYVGHASVRIPLRKVTPFMFKYHECDVILNLSHQEHWKWESRFVYTKKNFFYKILEVMDDAKFLVVQLEVEEFFEEVCYHEEFGQISLNMSKIGIYRFIGITDNVLVIKMVDIESNAALDHDPNGCDMYLVMVPRQSVRCN